MKTASRPHVKRNRRRALVALGMALTSISLGATLAPTPALAYFSKPAPSIGFGSGTITLTQGQSGSVGLSISPMSEAQLPGCGMSICPQACNGMANPNTGVVGGCLDGNGWCTCGGTEYYTAYTSVSASSSNPYVARASADGGALYITAVSPGTATITVYASLSKHEDAAASMTVNVVAPATGGDTSQGGGESSGGGQPSGGGDQASGGGAQASGSGGTASGGVTVSSAGTDVTKAAKEAAGGEKKEVVEMQTDDGAKIIVAEAKDKDSAKTELSKIVGTDGTVTFWSGGTMDTPAFSWTFKGKDLSADADLAIDPRVDVSKKGTGDVAKLLKDVKKSVVMDFKHEGKLPAPAEVYARVSGVFEDGSKIKLFSWDAKAGTFKQEQQDIEVKDGYAVFTIDHCSTWALSDEDLSALELTPEEQAESKASGEEADATKVDVHPTSGTPLVVAAVAVVVVVLAAVALVLRRKHVAKAAAAAGDAADETTALAADGPAGGEAAGVDEAVAEADEADDAVDGEAADRDPVSADAAEAASRAAAGEAAADPAEPGDEVPVDAAEDAQADAPTDAPAEDDPTHEE